VPGEKCFKQDAFLNSWLTCRQNESYQHLMIMAQGMIELNNTSVPQDMSKIELQIFLQPTFATLSSVEMRDFHHKNCQNNTRQQWIHLSEKLLEHMPYSPNITSVNTSAIDAFTSHQGVCQDHTHVLLAMARERGVPARYVSGYLYANNSAHLASHAWAELYLDGAWHCFDVSNQMFEPSAHVYIAIGRDYWDVAPVRGVRHQGGVESMNTIVQVLTC
jgi:transglutaminase/protease-like cytokinesis protein 3